MQSIITHTDILQFGPNIVSVVLPLNSQVSKTAINVSTEEKECLHDFPQGLKPKLELKSIIF